jgi:hypothetical protein
MMLRAFLCSLVLHAMQTQVKHCVRTCMFFSCASTGLHTPGHEQHAARQSRCGVDVRCCNWRSSAVNMQGLCSRLHISSFACGVMRKACMQVRGV